MVNNQKSILVFGGSDYQLSLAIECKKLNLFTVVIDPNPEAEAKDHVDAFEEVGGQDFEGTCKVIEKYNVDAIITAATDKPLVMMAKVAKKYNLNFFSEETARVATDKFLMKKKFRENNFPHAIGKLTEEITDDFQFPVVIKPTDNSGSRGVIFCDNLQDASKALNEAKQHTRKDQVLVEEVIEGTEYSIETLHYKGKTKVVQITEKIVTPLPYFVELGHIQPHNLPENIVAKIEDLMVKVAEIFNFENCGCHNEVKVKDGKITLIEVSPRIGGDFISSTLAKASTGINMEKALIQIVLGEDPDFSEYKPAASGIFFFHFKQGVFKSIKNLEVYLNRPEVLSYKFDLKPGDTIPRINVGTKRYGYVILKEENRERLLQVRDEIMNDLEVQIEKI